MSATDPTTPDAPRPRRRRRIPRWVWALVAVLVVVWLGAATWRLLEAQVAAQDGLDALEEVRGSATGDLSRFIDSIGDGDAAAGRAVVDPLRLAADEFSTAGDRVDSPVVAPLKLLPFVGRQVRSVSALSAAAATTSAAAADAYEALEREADAPVTTPEERLASIERTTALLDDLSDEVVGLDLGPDTGLVGPLADARDRFSEEYGRVEDTLTSAATAANGVSAFLTGPNRYLVLASNNAEMRAGSGMFLQVGPMDVAGGRFTLGELEPSGDLLLAAPGAELDPDVAALWGWALPGREFRNVNLTPRFDESARMAADMWELAGRGPVDGAVAIDIVGLRELLTVTGPVRVPGPDDGQPVEVSADNVERLLLVEQYEQLGDEQAERRELLGRVAGAVFSAFNERQVSASGLLRVLQDAGRGRHLLLWSSDPVQQDGWEALDASGILPEDSLMLATVNRNGTKLDQYLDVRATLTSSAPDEDGLRRVQVTAEVQNRAPEGLPTYVAGPYPGTDYGPGDYGGILSLTVPAGAGNFDAPGTGLYFSGDDGPTRVMTAALEVPRGGSRTITFAFDLPEGWDELEVLPSARVPAIEWTAGDETWSDAVPRTVPVDSLG